MQPVARLSHEQPLIRSATLSARTDQRQHAVGDWHAPRPVGSGRLDLDIFRLGPLDYQHRQRDLN
jgi:hypothetical protein